MRTENIQLSYWREQNQEVDFVLSQGKKYAAFEIKSGSKTSSHSGMESFSRIFHPYRKLLVGGGGIPLDQFFRASIEEWFV
ncbi:MAG: DUF4143 domain-containing protein [Verrucomicrobiota bacterium]